MDMGDTKKLKKKLHHLYLFTNICYHGNKKSIIE